MAYLLVTFLLSMAYVISSWTYKKKYKETYYSIIRRFIAEPNCWLSYKSIVKDGRVKLYEPFATLILHRLSSKGILLVRLSLPRTIGGAINMTKYIELDAKETLTVFLIQNGEYKFVRPYPRRRRRLTPKRPVNLNTA